MKAIIYKGFFWDLPLNEIPKNNQIKSIKRFKFIRVRRLIKSNLTTLSSHGWYRGIPDRTLLIPNDGIRLVYAGSQGDEIGVKSIDGSETLGFFKSEVLVNYLYKLERR